jgi:hypothetical protein
MPKPLAILLLLAIAVAATAMIKPFAPQDAARVQTVVGPPVMDQDIEDLFHQVDAALIARRFDTLEGQARAFRNPEAMFPGGYAKLWYFYAALGAFNGSNCECGTFFKSDVAFAEKRAALQAWLSGMPGSITAKIGMARLLTNQAWALRGHAYASATDQGKLDAFEDTMAQAYGYLRGLDAKQDPAVFGGLFSVARAADDGRAMAAQVYAGAVAAFPWYFPYYMSRADLLQEKWFGQAGELAAYVSGLAKEGKGDIGLVGYSFAAEKLMESNAARDLYTKLGIDWGILRRSLAVRGQLYGVSNKLRNVELLLAVGARDQAFAATLAKAIAGRWDPTVWQDAATFSATATWATQGSAGQ